MMHGPIIIRFIDRVSADCDIYHHWFSYPDDIW